MRIYILIISTLKQTNNMKARFTLLAIFLSTSFIALQAQKEVANENTVLTTIRSTDNNFRSGNNLPMDTIFPGIFNDDCSLSLAAFQPSDQWGFVGGTNGFNDIEKAQRFQYDGSSNYSVQEIAIFFAVNNVVNDGKVVVKIYDINPTTDGPGSLLGTSDTLQASELTADNNEFGPLATLFNFSTPAMVTEDEFFVSVDFSDLYNTMDTLAIWMTQQDCGDGADSWELFGDNTTWAPMDVSWTLESNFYMVAIIEFEESTSVEETENNIDFKVYPMPANNDLTLSYYLSTDSEVRVDILNIQGQSLISLNKGRMATGRQKEIIDLSHMSPGYYFARISTEQGVSTQKVIVAR
jgi:hypothetical protein